MKNEAISSRRDRLASSLPDAALIQPPNYQELVSRATELKRMLTALIQKLNAGR